LTSLPEPKYQKRENDLNDRLGFRFSTKSVRKVLICQGSDCCKRGSEKLSQELQAQLERENLDNQVTITATGCLKNCQQGVNLILMPARQKYCQVKSEQLPTIITQISVAEVTK